jgi:hypothetical protein
MTWVDVGALVPFYLQFVINAADMERFRILIMFRLLRIFRLFRFSYRLQIMVLALKGSLHELGLLLLILAISVVFFSTLVYYADGGDVDTKFVNIPTSFWWAIITLTTVGYGDDTPITWPGRIVGSVCALWGVLMITLPISIVNSNFSLYYAHAKAMLRLPKKVVKETFPPGTKRYLSVLSTISEMNFTGRLERELKFRDGITSPSQSNINLAVGALRMSSRKSISTKVARMKRLGNDTFQLLTIPKPNRPSVTVKPLMRRRTNSSTETVNIGILPPGWDGDLEEMYRVDNSDDEMDIECDVNDMTGIVNHEHKLSDGHVDLDKENQIIYEDKRRSQETKC